MEHKKTILISLSSNIVVGNFAMPGGVFERLGALARERDARLVFFVSPVFRDKIASSIQDADQRAEIIFEDLEKNLPKTFIEKAFFFFYSYLIFTGTTRLLATFGARADAPPAGGNRHLSIVKAAIANTFGRSRWFKRAAVPWLYSLIFRKRPHRKLFDKYRPDLVFVPNIAFFPDIELIAEARLRGIGIIGMAQNWDHLNKYFIPQHSDIILVQNEPMIREAVELHAYRPDQVRAVGFPQFDIYAKPEKYILKREDFEKEFGIQPGKKIILYISGSVYAPDEADILSEIAGWINNGQLIRESHLLVRPYVSKRDSSVEKKKYLKLANIANVSFNWQPGERSRESISRYMSMLHHADVIISVFSTTAIEGAIFDKSTIVIGFDGQIRRPPHQSVTRLEKLAHFRHIFETEGVAVAKGFEQLKRQIISAFSNPSHGREARQKLVEKMCYKSDGGAAERIVEALGQELNSAASTSADK